MYRATVVVVALSASRPAAAQGPPASAHPAAAVRCYRADRALGTSAGSAEWRGVPGPVGRRIGEDSGSLGRLTTFRLLPGGRVDRPGVWGRDWWARGSRWERAGDTLRVTLSTATSGWALALRPAPGSADTAYVGVARYLTDVIVTDSAAWRPPRVPVRVRREPCPPDA